MAGQLSGGGESHYAFIPANYYCPHVLLAGHGTVRTEQGEQRVGPGDMFCIWDGKPIEYFEDASDRWEYYWIHLEGAGTRPLLEAWGFSAERLVMRPAEPETVQRLFAQVVKSYAGKRPEDVYRIVAWLYELAAVTTPEPAAVRRAAPRGDRQLAEQARAMMAALVHTRIGVSEIAAGLGVSRTTLFRAFRSSGAGSPLDALQEVRVRRARELLENSDQKVAAVARACGFRDDKYFIRVFRRLTGSTPGQLRGEHKS